MALSTKETLITAADDEPVSLELLKAHLRVDSEDEDALLTEYLRAAREMVETITWRVLISQTWDVYFDVFASRLYLPKPPLSSVTSVKYVDSAGTTQTVSSSVWEAGEEDGIGLVRPAYDQTWPSDARGHRDDVVVRIVAGYGTGPSSVPRPLRQAILLLAGDFYEHREIHVTETRLMEVPTYKALLLPYRVRWEGSS